MYASRSQFRPIKMGKLEIDDTNEYLLTNFESFYPTILDIEPGIRRNYVDWKFTIMGRIDLTGRQNLIANVRVISGDTDTILFTPKNTNKKVIKTLFYKQIIPKIPNKMIKRMNKICRQVNPNRIGRRR